MHSSYRKFGIDLMYLFRQAFSSFLFEEKSLFFTAICFIIVCAHRGVAQLVARLVRDQEAGSSSLLTPTMRSVLIGFENPIKDTPFFYAQNGGKGKDCDC